MQDSVSAYLGRGVDLFDVDPWSPPTKESVMDDATAITSATIGAAGLSHMYADNFLDIKRQIAVEAGVSGSYGGFSGSVDAKYNHSDEVIQKRHFLKISFLITGNRLSVHNGRDGLKKHLMPEFLAVLNTQTPDSLFETYGTHIAVAIKTGGKAEYFCRSSDTTTMSADQFAVAATAKYQGLGGSIEGHTNSSSSSSSTQQDIIGSDSLLTLGGAADLAAGISSTGGWAEWAKSCHESPAFLGFDQNGLIPVWDLTDDTHRREQLREAYRRRAAKMLRTHIISETSEAVGHPEARVVVPEGYKLLSGGALDAYTGPGNLLTASFPESDNTWRVSGKDHGLSSPASITAYAIVTYDPDDIWDIVQTSNMSDPAGHPTCEIATRDGYVMIGGGARVQWRTAGNLLTASFPRDDRIWACAAKDHGAPEAALITAYAIGLKCNVPGLVIRQAIQKSSSNPDERPVAMASPPAGYVLVGGGAVANWTYAGSLLTASYPSDLRTWEARSKDHEAVESVVLDAYAVGVRVMED